MNKPSSWQIFASMIYDGLLLAGFCMCFMFIAEVIAQTPYFPREVSQALLFCFIGIYFILTWAKGSQTLAMRTWRLQLRDFKGNKAPLSALFIRYLTCWIIPLLASSGIYGISIALNHPNLNILIVLTPFSNLIIRYTNQNRFMLHDMLSKTMLISLK